MRRRLVRWIPVLALSGILAFPGCGNLPTTPTIDQLRAVPNSSQVTVISPDQLDPKQGPVGTFLTVHGRGITFPIGFVHVRFTGTAGLDFQLNQPAADLSFFVPRDALPGPLGFTISSRTSASIVDNALPGDQTAVAYQIPAPGFLVVPSPLVPPGATPTVQPQISPPNGN